jgi:UDP-sugar pyrophosphorylase
VEKLNDNYPGGLTAYISNARKLLADSKAGRNPFDGYSPSVRKKKHSHLLTFRHLVVE